MTLRCMIEIVPYGEEKHKQQIFKIDISNIGDVRDLGFGHQICTYSVKLFRKEIEVLKDMARARGEQLPEWALEKEVIISEHDRRDGAVELVRKATELLEMSVDTG